MLLNWLGISAGFLGKLDENNEVVYTCIHVGRKIKSLIY